MNLISKRRFSINNTLRNMRIVQFKLQEETRIGLLNGDSIIDVNASDNTIPRSVVKLLNQENALERLRRISFNPKQQHPLATVKLLSPITRPDKIVGLAANFKDDCDKRNVPYPKEPILFTKFPSIITGPSDDIQKPVECQQVDWEVELAVVIGKRARNVAAKDALDYVFGYTATQDLTAKDHVKNMGQMTLCKNVEGFCPLGPCLVTKDEIPDPYNIKLKAWVNGELKQDGNTKDMLFKIEQIVEYLTRTMTLLPGDVICTGTPFGVGASQKPPQFLQKGDVLETEVEKVGRMKHRFV